MRFSYLFQSWQGTGSTCQVVVATNGEFTYAIIQLAVVSSEIEYNSVGVLDMNGNLLRTIPYADDVQNAASNSNSGVPGRYIIDLNSELYTADYRRNIIS